MKKLIVGAVLTLAVAALLPRTASAGIWENGNWSNGIWSNGALLQGGERPAGPQCTERGVDLSAVRLAKVTVRLPRPGR